MPALLFLEDFQDIKLFQMKLRIGIHDNLLADNFFKAEDKMIFFSMEQFSHFRIDPDHDFDAIHRAVFPQNFPVDAVTDRFPGHEIPFAFTVKAGFA